MEITKVYDEHGDWEALYINGVLTQQGHSIRLYQFIEELMRRGIVTKFDSIEGNASVTGDSFPNSLDKVRVI